MNNLNEMQSLRSALVKEVNYDVEKAKKVWDFVMDYKEIKPVNPLLKNASPQRQNGIYYILSGGVPVHESAFDYNDRDKCIGVGVVMGGKFATVSLCDAADGDEVPLTEQDNTGDPNRFHKTFWEAMADWDGQGNTESMKSYLNPKIDLEEFEYIPSVAQLHLILLNINEINKALEYVGGTPLKEDCYWSSTEYSSNNSWTVHFNSGSTWYTIKYYSLTVRPSVACEL